MRRPVLGVLALLVTLGTGCGDAGSSDGDPLLVFAAASLTDALAEVAEAFVEENPGAQVEISFAASSALREQILEGAPADVYASANEAAMSVVEEAGLLADPPRLFALNSIQIAVPSGNPAGITGLADFGRDELLLGLCAEQVPCGIFGRQVLEHAGVNPSVDTNEPNVRALLTKVETGELDAALVYSTDVASSDAVDGIGLPSDVAVLARYPIAALAASEQPARAASFVEFVLSDRGRSILVDHGFRAP